MAEQIPFSIVEQLISALGSSALEEIKLAKGAKQELNKLRETVTSIDAVLQDAEEQQHKDKLVQQWIRRLRDVFYEADDLIDEVATESLRQKVDAEGRTKGEVRNFFSFPKKLVSRVKMGHQIKEIREKLDEITRDMSQFKFLPHKDVVDRGVVNNTRETDSAVPEDKIIGREKSEEYIIELLKQPDQNSDNVSVVAIVGMGGLGKTTLAQRVYNDERVANYFGEKMWVCVSEDFNVKTLIKKILQCLIRSDVGNLELEQLQRLLREKLEGKRYLLVLDDVWNENKESWDRLRKHLFFGAQGSKILMTTRSKKVTIIVGVDSKAFYELKGLTNEESWNLFTQVAFGGDIERASSSGLLEVGKELVRGRCKGVPLAIKTLASAMLSYPNEAYWLSMKENDQIWSLANNENEEDSILPVLKLSYYHLPNHLKQCFACCSIFQKDDNLPKQILISVWLAQGYVQSSIGNKDLEEIAEMYFNDLLSRSFFQNAKQGKLGAEVKMHDLIHDLAQMVSSSNCLITSLDKQNKIPEGVHHIAFNVRKIKPNEIMSILKPIVKGKTKLRTLALEVVDEVEKAKSSILDFVFSNFKCLRMLGFSSPIVELPSSIHKLKHLRYLVFCDCKFVKLPHTICDLLNLQSLFLFHCNYLEKLPKDLRKLVSLRHLIIFHCGSLTSLPDSCHQLSSLQRLMIYECRELSERCRKDDGPDWWKIQHIPNIRTDCGDIGRWS